MISRHPQESLGWPVQDRGLLHAACAGRSASSGGKLQPSAQLPPQRPGTKPTYWKVQLSKAFLFFSEDEEEGLCEACPQVLHALGEHQLTGCGRWCKLNPRAALQPCSCPSQGGRAPHTALPPPSTALLFWRRPQEKPRSPQGTATLVRSLQLVQLWADTTQLATAAPSWACWRWVQGCPPGSTHTLQAAQAPLWQELC